jgi:dihydroflavonol-4-reductase
MFLRKRHVELVPGSLQEPEQLREAMRDCDAVFLTGAHYPRYSLDEAASVAEGVSGVRNVCNAALEAGVPRLVYTSTIATLAPVHGRAATETDRPTEPPDSSMYRAVKWAMEREVDAAAARGLHTITLLPGGCIGAGDMRLGTAGLLVLVVRGELPFWVDGIVNLVDVEDVAEAHVAALRAAPGSRYALAGEDVRFGDLLERIVSRYGGKVPERISAELARLTATADERAAAPRKARVAFPRELVDIITGGQPVDCTRATRELGVPFSALEPAFDRAHAFFQRYGYIPRKNHSERQSA